MDNWEVDKCEEKDNTAVTEGSCPFHPEKIMEIARVNYHFLFRCEEAKKHMSEGKYYRFCNCGNVFIDLTKYNSHAADCIYSAKHVEIKSIPIFTQIEQKWHNSNSDINQSDIEILPGKCNAILKRPTFHDSADAIEQKPAKKKRYFD
jgi:hypothetical protein